MDQLIKEMGTFDGGDTVTVMSSSVAMIVSFLLALMSAYVYRVTYRGTSYSQSYTHTLILMSVITSVIMIIIGSNIARAFSLVGALSIIRFRAAVKDTRDVAFIFLAMAIGMACGTRFYDVAIVFTFVMTSIVFFLHKFDIGAQPSAESVLKLLVDSTLDHEKAFQDIFCDHLVSHALLSIDSVSPDTIELIYSIEIRTQSSERELLKTLQALDGCNRASVIRGLHDINV